MSALTLKNPHSVLAALEHRPQEVLEIRLARRSPAGAWQQVVDQAKAAGVPVRIITPDEPRRPHGKRHDGDGRVGSAEAVVREPQPLDLEDLFNLAAVDGYGVWLALDQIQDPHNLGAIFRTASFFGVRGIVLTKHQSAPITSTVCDVASGGVESVPFAVETNLVQSISAAKQAGLWVLGTSEHERQSLWNVARDRHWLVVLGSEESGLRRLTLENCDELCGIPARGKVGSLNVSVATSVVLAALAGRPA